MKKSIDVSVTSGCGSFTFRTARDGKLMFSVSRYSKLAQQLELEPADKFKLTFEKKRRK